MNASVIVTTYNRPDALVKVLNGLAHQTHEVCKRPPDDGPTVFFFQGKRVLVEKTIAGRFDFMYWIPDHTASRWYRKSVNLWASSMTISIPTTTRFNGQSGT